MLEILLVEDNPGDALLVKTALASHHIDHNLHLVRDGEEVIDYASNMGASIQSPYPDLILLDLNLPKADGATLLLEFRKHAECVNTPVIVVTSSDTPKDRARMTALGIAHYFKKPFHFQEFLKLGAIVLEVLESRASAT